jgi:hypothetical protein
MRAVKEPEAYSVKIACVLHLLGKILKVDRFLVPVVTLGALKTLGKMVGKSLIKLETLLRGFVIGDGKKLLGGL